MNNFLAITLAIGCGLAASGSAYSHPVLYTLTTVSDGSLGSLSFTQAVVTIKLRSDSRSVQNNSGVYTNGSGTATVSVTQEGRTTTATFTNGQIFARFDTVQGVVGFGSAISPTYPIAVGCGTENCLTITGAGGSAFGASGEFWGYDYGTVGAQVYSRVTTNSSRLSTDAQDLPANLSQPTVLTGTTTACAVPYGPGSCPTPASMGLLTDKGAFYLQDSYGFVSYEGVSGYGIFCNYNEPSPCDGNDGTFTVEVADDD